MLNSFIIFKITRNVSFYCSHVSLLVLQQNNEFKRWTTAVLISSLSELFHINITLAHSNSKCSLKTSRWVTTMFGSPTPVNTVPAADLAECALTLTASSGSRVFQQLNFKKGFCRDVFWLINNWFVPLTREGFTQRLPFLWL